MSASGAGKDDEMPVIEVELGDDGSIGKLPEPLQKFFDKRFDEAVRKGAEKTEAKLNPYLTDPVEMERLRQRDQALAKIELEVAERDKQYETAKKMREEAYAKEKADAVTAEKKNTAKAVERVRASVAKTIRAAALASGARDESLGELERLLAVEVDLDDELNEYVKDAGDPKKPRLDANGQPVTVEGLVADYLQKHTHHLKATPAASGKARGGATFAGAPLVTDERGRAREAVAADPSVKNVAALLTTALTRKE